MINLENVSKSFDDVNALDDITMNISDNTIFGLIGTNGAGKSTLLKILSGILRQDNGIITIDDEPVYENINLKNNIFYLSDDYFIPTNDNAIELAGFYKNVYSKFDLDLFLSILDKYELDPKRRIGTLSKGMKKQVLLAIGFATNAKYMLCDETFDGLDPLIRQITKKIMIERIEDNGLVPIIASHNLRELEDICDNIGLLHKSKLLLQSELSGMKLGLNKVQCVFKNSDDIEKMNKSLNIINIKESGSVKIFTIRNNVDEINKALIEIEPLFYEILDLTLEEIFISETEAKGYEASKYFV